MGKAEDKYEAKRKQIIEKYSKKIRQNQFIQMRLPI